MFYHAIVILVLSIMTEAAPKSFEKDMEEVGEYFEGDIILAPYQRNGIIDESQYWPNAIVYYKLDSNFSPSEKDKIFAAWKEISDSTCVTFKLRTSEINYVHVLKTPQGDGCSSELGMQVRRQFINLAPECLTRHGTLIHETLHSLGFLHEQSRQDRDAYVTINFDKIVPGFEPQFQLPSTFNVSTFGAPYDYGSVLHYSRQAFSVDGSPTIIPKIPGVTIGQRKWLSELDAGKVRVMYSCDRDLNVT